MKLSQSSKLFVFTSVAVAASLLLSGFRSLSAPNEVIMLELGKTSAVELDASETQDFRIDVDKGSYTVYVDAEADKNKIVGNLKLLKMNGASFQGANSNEINIDGSVKVRHGGTYKFTVNTPVRIRLKNGDGDICKYWVTVVSAEGKTVPKFGFDAEVLKATIGAAGNEGKLKPQQVIYYKTTIPKGKYNISLGVESLEGTAYATLDLLDSRGFVKYSDRLGNMLMVNPNNGEKKRGEMVVKFLKDTSVMIRIESDIISANEFPYDLTIALED